MLAAVICSSCTHLVWYGRSDDRRHFVSVIERGSTQHVRLDMVDGPDFLGVGVDALALVEGHLVYPAQRSDGWVVVRDGIPGPSFDAIGELQFNGAHLAYSAEKSGKWQVILDGTSSEPFDTILPASLTLTPTGRLAFASQQGPHVFAIVDGKRSAPIDAIGQLRFSNDGARSGFVARRQGAHFVVLDAIERGPFDSVSELQLEGAHDLFIARSDKTSRVFIDGEPGEPFERIAGLIEGPAYAARRGKEEWIIDGARQLGPFTSLKSRLTRDGSGRLIFVAQRGDSSVVFIGDTESGPWTEVEAPAIGGVHVGFIAEKDDRNVVIIDGKEVSTWEWASSLVLSPDGSRLAHLARRGGKTFVVVDGTELSFDVVVSGTLAFSRDGRHFGCVTGEAKTRRLFITRDDGKRTPVDLEELVAALSRGNPDALLTSPDVTLLRRWVEAELELLR